MNIIEEARKVFDTEIRGLEDVRDSLGKEFIDFVNDCFETISHGGKLVFTGIGKSAHISRKIAATLTSTGAPSIFMYPIESMHGDLGIVAKDDLVIAVSYSGETNELLVAIPPIKNLGVKVVAVTGNKESRLVELSDSKVIMKVTKEACPFNLAPTTTTTALLALGDALAMILMQMKNFSKQDYGKRHPAGAIGRSLTFKVKDIMIPIENIAVVSSTDKIRKCYLEMMKKACSIAVVNDGSSFGFVESKKVAAFINGTSDNDQKQVSAIKEETSVVQPNMALIDVAKKYGQNIPRFIVAKDAAKILGIVDTKELKKLKI